MNSHVDRLTSRLIICHLISSYLLVLLLFLLLLLLLFFLTDRARLMGEIPVATNPTLDQPPPDGLWVFVERYPTVTVDAIGRCGFNGREYVRREWSLPFGIMASC